MVVRPARFMLIVCLVASLLVGGCQSSRQGTVTRGDDPESLYAPTTQAAWVQYDWPHAHPVLTKLAVGVGVSIAVVVLFVAQAFDKSDCP
jgi:hypothetical protein